MHLLQELVRVEPLQSEELILQIEEAQLDLLDGAPLKVEVALLGRVAVAHPPMEAVKFDLVAEADQWADLLNEVGVVQTLEGTPRIVKGSAQLLVLGEQLYEIEVHWLVLCHTVVGLIKSDRLLALRASVFLILLKVMGKAGLT